MPNVRPDYGFDAPGFVRAALLGGAVAVALSFLVPPGWGWPGAAARFALSIGGTAYFMRGVSLIGYGRLGKFWIRDAMLGMVSWRGDEAVLDVGTGRGLLLAGAAKRLVTGRATGLDIWQASDLSGNLRSNAERNLAAEGVADRASLHEADIRDSGLPDAAFDVVLSLQCLHNIPDRAGRDAACREIARLLKPGGTAIIGDYVWPAAYERAFRDAGLEVGRTRNACLPALSMLWIVTARKPNAARSRTAV